MKSILSLFLMAALLFATGCASTNTKNENSNSKKSGESEIVRRFAERR